MLSARLCAGTHAASSTRLVITTGLLPPDPPVMNTVPRQSNNVYMCAHKLHTDVTKQAMSTRIWKSANTLPRYSSQKVPLPTISESEESNKPEEKGKSWKYFALGNINVPGLLKKYEKILPGSGIKVKKPMKNIAVDDTKSPAVVNAKGTNQYWAEDLEINREQFNFEEAMINVHESVSTYYLDLGRAQQANRRGAIDPRPSGRTVSFDSISMNRAPSTDNTTTSSSFVDQLKRYIPGTKDASEEAAKRLKLETSQKGLVSRSSIDRRTRALVTAIKKASSETSKLIRINDLCKHLAQYPSGKGLAVQVCTNLCTTVLVLIQSDP